MPDRPNNNHAQPLPGTTTVEGDAGMAMFDRQPLWLKQLLWYAAVNVVPNDVARDVDRAVMTAELARLEYDHARALWGPSYPIAVPRAVPSPARARRTKR